MSENMVDKTLVVTSVNVVTELATGNLAYQVTFGEYIKSTPEIINRLPANVRENYPGNQIAVNEILLLIKTDKAPYTVGSKWELKVHKDGTLNLVELK